MPGTVEFFTGFEGVSSNTEVSSFFPASYLITYSATGGYDNGKCLRMTNNTSYVQLPTTAATTKVVGWHARNIGQASYSSANGAMVVKFSGPDIRLFNTPGGLELYRGATLLASSLTVLSTDLQWLEAKLVSHATSGTFELRIDGVSLPAMTLSSLNTGGAVISGIQWGGIQTPVGGSYYLDNTTVASDWVGEQYSILRVPTSDLVTGFDPASGIDRYAMLDEVGQDSDATYVYADATGSKILCGYADLPAGVEVTAVTRVTIARKLDAGTRVITPYARQTAVDYLAPPITLGTNYPTARHDGIQTLATAPDGTTWSRDKFNAVDWGAELTT